MKWLTVVLVLMASFAHGQGTGLTGQYYDTAAFGTLKTTRTDPTIQFAWGTGIPSGTTITNADTFSVAWSGQLEPEFNETYTFYVTADDGARLWVDDQLLVTRTFAQGTGEMRGQMRLTAGQRVNLRLEYIEQTGSASVKLEWSAASRAREVIPVARLFPARADRAGGSILKEHWSGIAGAAINGLTGSANYPNKPTGRELLTSFECLSQNWADSYGTRVTGYLVAPTTGTYTFAISGDEVVQLYLSTDTIAANKTLIASITSATSFRQWDAQSSQLSAPRTLIQGQRYYIELLHKEDTGSDHWSVGWRKPGDADFSVVPGSALVQAGIERAQPAQANVLDTMAQTHPRLFATTERFTWLKTQWLGLTSSTPKTWAQNAINSANTILTQAPVTYAPDVRGTILSESRTVVSRMYALGVAWHLTGDAQYAERAWTELEAAAAFPDWHPAHFLDTAEMSHGFAIGYDWFYNYWTSTRRDTIRNALINKGLNVGLSQYTSNAWWSQSDANNWNCVCNGGLALGALAVGSENETLTEDILNRAITSVRPVLKHFTTDNGNWYEGPGYWGYTMEYAMRMFAGLEWVLGSDFGLSTTRNFADSGFAPIHSTGPSNIIFNYADAGAGGAPRGSQFAWLARRFGQSIFGWWENQGSGGPLDALWYADSTTSPQSVAASPDMAFHGEAGTGLLPQEMVTMRGRWNDTRTTFIGCKGGQMAADHGNLDAGTFVLDALGKRWFHDLGGDNYALAGYFTTTPNASGTDRWDYYRMRAEGQNTLVINPSAAADMTLNAVAPLIAFQAESGGTSSLAIHDLTPVYTGMTRVWRGARLMGSRNQVLMQDEIVAGTGKTVWWFAHYKSSNTTAVIDNDGTSATLTQGSERLWCKIVSGGGTFQIRDAVPFATSPNPTGQNANADFKKLAINLTNVTNTTLAVWFVPLAPGEFAPSTLPSVIPLNTWNLAAANDPPIASNGTASSSDDQPVDIDLRNYVTDDSTPAEQMRFNVGGAVNGTVVLLADGHTARFTPDAGYTGVPTFTFTATDTTADSRVVLAYDFDGPDPSDLVVIPDVSGHGRDGTLDAVGTGAAALIPDAPAALGSAGRSLDLVENGGANAARLSRVIGSTELNFNTSDWTITGWVKRRDTANDDMIWHLNSGDGFGSNEELYLVQRSGANLLQLHHYPGPDVEIGSSTVPSGAWRHFAVVRTGSTVALYLDGVLIGSDNSFAFNINQAYPLIFGGHTDTSATFAPRWYDGQLDDLAVFNASLSPEEIIELASGMSVRHFGGLTATATITLSATPVTTVWTATGTNNALPWSDGINWSGGGTPASGRGTTLQFFNGQTVAGGSITSHNNLAGPFQLNVLTLAGTTSATTTATITGGALALFNNGTLNPIVNLSATVGAGFVYDVTAPVTLSAPTTFAGSGSASFRFTGNITGDGAITKTGSATLILTGTNNYTGETTIGAGTLQIGMDGATGSLGDADVINNGTLRIERTGTLLLPNNISGTGSLLIDCPINLGTVVANGSNSFTGGVTINSGALRISNSTALGEGSKIIKLTAGTLGNPQLRLDGAAYAIELPAEFTFETSNENTGAVINESGDNTINGDFRLTGGGGATKIVASGGSLTLTGSFAPITTSRWLRLAGGASGLITGPIQDGASPNNLTGIEKMESSTWTLAGPINHTGSVKVSAGTLIINSGTTAASSVSVSAGATLGGSGTINAPTTLDGNHAPGPAGIGAQAFGASISYGGASHLQWELGNNSASNPGVAFDQVTAAMASITTDAVVDIFLNRAGSATAFAQPFWQTSHTWPVLTASSITGTFKLGTISPDIDGRPASGYGTFSLQHTGTAVNLIWTPLPPIQQWRYTHFATNSNTGNAADTMDPDKDGLRNLAEYATARNPNAADLADIACERKSGILEFNYTRNKNATDVTCIVEWSDTLAAGSWSITGVTEVIVTDDGVVQEVKASVATAGIRRFIRLKVTQP